MVHGPMARESDFEMGMGIQFGQEIDVVIYVPRKGELACLIWSKRKEMTAATLEKDAMIGEKLMGV